MGMFHTEYGENGRRKGLRHGSAATSVAARTPSLLVITGILVVVVVAVATLDLASSHYFQVMFSTWLGWIDYNVCLSITSKNDSRKK